MHGPFLGPFLQQCPANYGDKAIGAANARAFPRTFPTAVLNSTVPALLKNNSQCLD